MASIANEGTVTRWDVDSISRPVVALSASMVSKNWEQASHQHRKAQLLYSVRGVLNCEVEDGVWIVPPHSAVWIPGGLPHATRGSGETECYCLFVEPDAAPDLPRVCCTIGVSPLLRELLLKAAGFLEDTASSAREDRLIATLLDELSAAPLQDLHLPLPRDRRLRRLAEMLLADPAVKIPVHDWASRIGMSERSMSRLLLQEIGMSFGRWRRQLHVILSLQRMIKGESVQAVALELGYEGPSGFITMFRKTVGKPPVQYLSTRSNSLAAHDSLHVPAILLPEDVSTRSARS
ncbi:AraC family transcriptional regulator [Pseudomonas sp. Leaf127]|uniref:AraC family transcriptional regulator n=1 Tax=Pseudomonas sp. Leaf127 TaxID=1736267 RepID=UPI000702C52E|nr:helix-turn-helix transcriptional regulator [Pseudomonas sp. Leaf127]KQQ56818.1 AraC family transcriptional regulator [Pseudomonas sp. Leaf127]